MVICYISCQATSSVTQGENEPVWCCKSPRQPTETPPLRYWRRPSCYVCACWWRLTGAQTAAGTRPPELTTAWRRRLVASGRHVCYYYSGVQNTGATLLISSIMFCDLEVDSSKLEEDFCPSLVTHSSASGCHGNPLVCHPS